MKLPDPLTADERAKRWWSDWRKVDFSWRSIGDKPWTEDPDLGEDATLQDYWRREPESGASRSDDELLQIAELERDPAGRLWHRVHVPPFWSDGSPTWKADPRHENWTQFWTLIRARLQQANPHDVGFASGSDDDPAPPAPLAGIVFGEPPADWTWHDDFDRLNAEFLTCAFLGAVSFSGVESTAGLDLRRCLFAAWADFDDIAIDGSLRLAGATFLSGVWMARPEIAGDLELRGAHFHGEVTILKGRVDGSTQASECVFHAPWAIESTTFAGDVDFSLCRFLDLASFALVRFRGMASFQATVFSSDADFAGRTYGEFRGVGCTFEGDVAFEYMFFYRDAWFAATRFKGSALFEKVRFRARASFRNAAFQADVRFPNVRFRHLLEFHNTVFGDVADMTGCRFPVEARFYQDAFRGADFRRLADFTIPGFAAWGAFGGTSFQQNLLFAREALRDDASFISAFEAAERAAKADAQADGSTYSQAINRRFGQLEAAFQALNQAMARQQSRLDEHRFYRLELLARRRYSGTSALERLIIRLYDASSRCGTSFARPLVLLAVLIPLCGLGYWAATQPSQGVLAALNPVPLRGPDPTLIDAMRFSIENVTQPMGVWKSRAPSTDPRDAWADALLSGGDATHFLVVRLAATAQSFVSIALLFLAALGFKRQFQMNA